MMKCINCGSEVPDQSAFCFNCGSKVPEQQAPDTETGQLDEVPEAPMTQAAKEPAASAEPAAVFCPQCGKNAKPETVFCTNCGRNLKQTAASAAAAAGYQQPGYTGYQQTGYQQANYQSGWQSQPVGQYPTAAQYGSTAVKKKSKKGLMVFLIILAVIIVAGAITAAFAGRDVMRMIRGPKKSYIAAESKQLKEYTSDLVSGMIKDNAGETEKGGRIFDMNLDLNTSALGMDPTMQTTLKNILIRNTFMYDDLSESRIYNKLDFVVGDEDVLTIEALKDDDQLMLGIPQLVGTYLMADDQDMEEMTGSGLSMNMGNISVIGQLLTTGLEMEQKDVEKSVNQLVDITLKYIDDAEFEKNVELEVGSLTARYNCYTVTTSGENLRDMIVEILETVRDDEVFYELFSEFGSLAAEGDTADLPSYDEWVEEIDILLDEIENDDSDLENIQIMQKIYVDKKDNIHGRHLVFTDEYDEEVLNLQYYDEIMADDEYATALIIDSEGEKMELIALYTKDGEEKTGTMTVKMSDQSVIEAEFTDFASFDMKDETWYTGSASITIGDPAGYASQVINWDGSYDDDRYQMALGLDNYGTITIGYQIIDGNDIEIPALSDVQTVHVTDEEGLQSLMTEDVMINLQNIMSSMGISEDVLAGLMMGGYDDGYEEYQDYEDLEDWEDLG